MVAMLDSNLIYACHREQQTLDTQLNISTMIIEWLVAKVNGSVRTQRHGQQT